MIDRRDFIKGALLAGAAPRLACALPTTRNAAVQVVVDADCLAARHFQALCTQPTQPLGAPLRWLEQLARASSPAAFGLGRDSGFFVVSQACAAYGYRLVYHGEHDFGGERLRHHLRGAHGPLDDLAADLGRAGAQWPSILARAVPRLAMTDDIAMAASHHIEAAHDDARRGHLVSWCLRRA
ncbi:MAG: hypothetical protein IPG43_24685 [Proteobacteria bacterium]|nr:hypothetical protein [Pseudomonadota bacterium]